MTPFIVVHLFGSVANQFVVKPVERDRVSHAAISSVICPIF